MTAPPSSFHRGHKAPQSGRPCGTQNTEWIAPQLVKRTARGPCSAGTGRVRSSSTPRRTPQNRPRMSSNQPLGFISTSSYASVNDRWPRPWVTLGWHLSTTPYTHETGSMERDDLISCTPDAMDKRVTSIALTERGRPAQSYHHHRLSDQRKRNLRNFPEHHGQLISDLTTISKNLTQRR